MTPDQYIAAWCQNMVMPVPIIEKMATTAQPILMAALWLGASIRIGEYILRRIRRE
jgi:hypothetical protein